MVGDADVIAAKDKAAKADKKTAAGGKAEGSKDEKKEQKEKVPAEIPQVRCHCRRFAASLGAGCGGQMLLRAAARRPPSLCEPLIRRLRSLCFLGVFTAGGGQFDGA